MYLKDIEDMDERMIPICNELTRKGYVTRASCEGHVLDIVFSIYDGWLIGHIDMYIMFEKDCIPDLTNLPKNWGLDYGLKMINFETGKPYSECDIIEYHDPDVKIGRFFKIRKATKKEMDAFKSGTIDNLVRSYDIGSLNLMDIEERRIQALDDMYEWVKKLPQRSGFYLKG